MGICTLRILLPWQLKCKAVLFVYTSEAILGYNLTEVPAMMNQKTVRAVGHKFIKNQVHCYYSTVSLIRIFDVPESNAA